MNRILSTALQATNDLKSAAVTARDNLTAFRILTVRIANKSYAFASATVDRTLRGARD